MTEKDYNPNMKEKKSMIKQTQVAKQISKGENLQAVELQPKTSEKKEETEKLESNEKEAEIKTEEKKPEIKKIPAKKIKKTEAVVNIVNLPISTKHSMALCNFIRGKKIQKALEDLELALRHKKPVPMKGEIPHRKGVKGIASGSGRYPENAIKQFIIAVKSLGANANNNLIDEPIIVEAIPNMGSRPFRRFGRMRKKRTHLRLKVVELSSLKKLNKERKNDK